ncbi:ras-related protein Rab-17 isoform X3 [Castor canadensis]|uniref:Ras-related protein Rab-17 isoform X3 n=1 Tax=Castor canadensis TaxID=51338 RepID=A0AC58MFJ6_CASCN
MDQARSLTHSMITAAQRGQQVSGSPPPGSPSTAPSPPQLGSASARSHGRPAQSTALGPHWCWSAAETDSFHKAQQWLAELEKEHPVGEVVVMLVGNKTDLGEQREVTLQEGKEFAESKNLLFMETSAKLNDQVSEVFSTVAQELLRREKVRKSHTPGNEAVDLNEGPARQARCCAH